MPPLIHGSLEGLNAAIETIGGLAILLGFMIVIRSWCVTPRGILDERRQRAYQSGLIVIICGLILVIIAVY